MAKRKGALITVLGTAAAITAGIIVLLLAMTGHGADTRASIRPPAALPDTRLPAATPTASTAGLTRMVIPAIGVDAPISVKGIGAGGAMELPNGPADVAWYGFSGRPGTGSNAVFSAHLDYRGYGPAVFAQLRDLRKGDVVEVHLADGTVYQYEVVLSLVYAAATAPSQEIVGPTSREMITLITCAGSFDETTRQYSDRLVVRAERL